MPPVYSQPEIILETFMFFEKSYAKLGIFPELATQPDT